MRDRIARGIMALAITLAVCGVAAGAAHLIAGQHRTLPGPIDFKSDTGEIVKLTIHYNEGGKPRLYEADLRDGTRITVQIGAKP